jgi:hypothetical protein
MLTISLFDANERDANAVGLQKLDNWFNFWHLCVKQWGGFMIRVMFPSFFTFSIPSCLDGMFTIC